MGGGVGGADDRTNIEALLDLLPEMMSRQPDGNRVAAGAAIRGALSGLVSADDSLC